MDRFTRKDAEAAFGILVKHMGGRIAQSYDDVGAYRLDYYQGFNVERIHNAQGGVTNPLGSRRQTAREFVQAVRFATDAIYEASQNAQASAKAS